MFLARLNANKVKNKNQPKYLTSYPVYLRTLGKYNTNIFSTGHKTYAKNNIFKNKIQR